MQPVAAELSDLASAAIEAALVLARANLNGEGAHCRFTVIGMGKCGGRELNYVSDVDVIYVVEPVEGADEAPALNTGARLAGLLSRICSAVTAEGTLWPLDPNLRPVPAGWTGELYVGGDGLESRSRRRRCRRSGGARRRTGRRSSSCSRSRR